MPKRKRKPPDSDRKFKPTEEMRELVWAAVANKIPSEQIALGVINPATNRPIGLRTLQRHFPEELRSAASRFRAEVALTIVKGMRANKTNSTAIFLSKVLNGLRERMELTGKEGAPLDFTALTDEQLDGAIRRLEASIAPSAKGRKAA